MRTLVALAAVALWAMPALATVYTDTTGEIISNSIIDISSVEVTNTATDLIVKINTVGDIVATDWGKYMVGIDSAPGGDTAGNGWARPISMSSGMDYWFGGWADSGNGLELRNWTGSAWNLQSATYLPNPDSITVSKTTNSITYTANFAGMGLAIGNTFQFDVYTSGGGSGDGAIDALGNPAQSIANWGDPYNSGSLVVSYTLVPEPAALALLGMGAAMMLRRRR